MTKKKQPSRHSHDWADHDAIRILERIADAASQHSSLVVVEQPVAFLCSPNPFPPASMIPYFMDLQMMVAVNALERTQPQYEALAAKAGWKLEKVWKTGRDGQEGPYRHYEFKLSSERARANRKRDDKGSNGSTGVASSASLTSVHSSSSSSSAKGGDKDLVRAMRSTGLVGLRTNGSSGSSRSSEPTVYRRETP